MSKVGSRSTTYRMKWSVNCQPIGEGENPLLSHGSGALNPTVGGTTPVVQKSMPPRLKSSTPCGPAEIAHGLAGIDDVAVIVAQRRQVFLQRVGLARCQAGRVAAGAGGGDEALGVERAFGRVLDELVDHAVRRVAAVVHGGIDHRQLGRGNIDVRRSELDLEEIRTAQDGADVHEGVAGDDAVEIIREFCCLDHRLAPAVGAAIEIRTPRRVAVIAANDLLRRGRHFMNGAEVVVGELRPGVPDRAKLTDYYFRAVHEVASASKEIVRRYYGNAPRRAYFDGCSNGGRQAMVEATKFPDDFDGIISGDPFMDIRTILGGANFFKIQLASSDVYIPATKLPMIDAAVYNSCDAADGMVDQLIQNPAKCSFDPKSLVTASCTGSDPTCLTSGEANTLQKYLTALRDDDGNIVYTGQTVSDLRRAARGARFQSRWHGFLDDWRGSADGRIQRTRAVGQ